MIKTKGKYCIDCKHYLYWANDYGKVEECTHPHWIKGYKCHPRRRQITLIDEMSQKPMEFNKNCDCELYEREWWKFWR